jgi:hypothetical protein
LEQPDMPMRARSGLIAEARARNGVMLTDLVLDARSSDCP